MRGKSVTHVMQPGTISQSESETSVIADSCLSVRGTFFPLADSPAGSKAADVAQVLLANAATAKYRASSLLKISSERHLYPRECLSRRRPSCCAFDFSEHPLCLLPHFEPAGTDLLLGRFEPRCFPTYVPSSRMLDMKAVNMLVSCCVTTAETFQIVKRRKRAFKIAGLTWIVERRFACLSGNRRVSKDYEYMVQTSRSKCACRSLVTNITNVILNPSAYPQI